MTVANGKSTQIQPTADRGGSLHAGPRIGPSEPEEMPLAERGAAPAGKVFSDTKGSLIPGRMLPPVN
ncbi:hypothetical protein DEA8626_00732 [Defluviimonas aquaemixtae]|uniref:Uncharacterized protein n=1 Tax=Albidovulum aquaemixtae TaxID=1542388 RepID=A0A2R8B3M2_9RHOB|nr:hypothetical protein [Defluviimonas aquaemixtae]SPH17216.1 hypothetical protein DEA8626_00732 [Defluviimonas aquaemixtae]